MITGTPARAIFSRPMAIALYESEADCQLVLNWLMFDDAKLPTNGENIGRMVVTKGQSLNVEFIRTQNLSNNNSIHVFKVGDKLALISNSYVTLIIQAQEVKIDTYVKSKYKF